MPVEVRKKVVLADCACAESARVEKETAAASARPACEMILARLGILSSGLLLICRLVDAPACRDINPRRKTLFRFRDTENERQARDGKTKTPRNQPRRRVSSLVSKRDQVCWIAESSQLLPRGRTK